MVLNIGKEVAALKRMALAQLRGRYAEVTGEETRCRHKDSLVRRIAWRLQVTEAGDLSERARRRAKELAQGADVRLTPPRELADPANGCRQTGTIFLSQDDRLPMPGAVIVREYKGETRWVRSVWWTSVLGQGPKGKVGPRNWIWRPSPSRSQPILST